MVVIDCTDSVGTSEYYDFPPLTLKRIANRSECAPKDNVQHPSFNTPYLSI